MIRKLSITKLFGNFNYDIDFRKDDDKSVTLLTGGNGYGKTTILSIIKRLYDADWLYFYQLPIESICVEFEDSNTEMVHKLEIERQFKTATTEDEISNAVDLVVFNFYEGSRLVEQIKLLHNIVDDVVTACKERPLIRGNSAYILNMAEILDSEHARNDVRIQSLGRTLRLFLMEKHCCLVPAQREGYHSENHRDEKTMVGQIATKIAAMISKQRAAYGLTSGNIDGSFIQRLIARKEETAYPEDEYKHRIEDLRRNMLEYKRLGLIDTDSATGEYVSQHSLALSQYVDDMKDKLDAISNFADRLRLFEDILNRKGLVNKKFGFNQSEGLTCTQNGLRLPLHLLSSGERNLIILYYNLIFNLKDGGVILIDEPENSMHVAWLASMLEDFQQLSKVLKVQIIVATHSPSLINNQWDMAFDLEENKYIA